MSKEYDQRESMEGVIARLEYDQGCENEGDSLTDLAWKNHDVRFLLAHIKCLELCLREAIARVEIANAEGDQILSAWLVDAKALLSNDRQIRK